MLSLLRAQVQSLVRELVSFKPQGVEKRANVYNILNGKSIFQNNINSVT